MSRAAFRCLSALTLAGLVVFAVVGMRPAPAAAQDNSTSVACTSTSSSTSSTSSTSSSTATCITSVTCTSTADSTQTCTTETAPPPLLGPWQECLEHSDGLILVACVLGAGALELPITA